MKRRGFLGLLAGAAVAPKAAIPDLSPSSTLTGPMDEHAESERYRAQGWDIAVDWARDETDFGVATVYRHVPGRLEIHGIHPVTAMEVEEDTWWLPYARDPQPAMGYTFEDIEFPGLGVHGQRVTLIGPLERWGLTET